MPRKKVAPLTSGTGFIQVDDTAEENKLGGETTWFDRHPDGETSASAYKDPRKSFANEQTFEGRDTVIPVLVAAVTNILTVGAIAPHRSAIRQHLSDRALDAAISKLQSIRRG